MIRSLYILAIFFISSYLVFAQDVILSNLNDIYPDDYVRMTQVNPVSGDIINTRKTNIISSQLYFFESRIEISGIGKYLISAKNNVFQNETDFYSKANTPQDDMAQSEFSFSPDESMLLKRIFIESSNNTRLEFYTSQNNEKVAEYSINNTKILDMNKDASALVYQDNDLIVLERHGNQFERYIVDRSGTYPKLSADGKRLIYRAGQDNSHKLYYVDRTAEGWTEPNVIPLQDKNGDAVEFRFDTQGKIHDIANNGKTVLYYDNDFLPMLIHEANGVWSKPEPIDFEHKHESISQNRFLMSDDGRIISIQNLVKDIWDNQYFYDVYILIKTSDGKWHRHNINTAGLLVAPDIYMTDDGTKLFWLPVQTSSVSPSLNY